MSRTPLAGSPGNCLRVELIDCPKKPVSVPDLDLEGGLVSIWDHCLITDECGNMVPSSVRHERQVQTLSHPVGSSCRRKLQNSLTSGPVLQAS